MHGVTNYATGGDCKVDMDDFVLQVLLPNRYMFTHFAVCDGLHLLPVDSELIHKYDFDSITYLF